jgi:hypothetical protein
MAGNYLGLLEVLTIWITVLSKITVKNFVEIGDVLVVIRTVHLPNTSTRHVRSTNQHADAILPHSGYETVSLL